MYFEGTVLTRTNVALFIDISNNRSQSKMGSFTSRCSFLAYFVLHMWQLNFLAPELVASERLIPDHNGISNALHAP